MGKISFEIFEDQFLVNSTQSYNLSILVGMDRFSYLISNNQQQVLGLRSYLYPEPSQNVAALKTALHNVFLEDKLLQLSYQKTTIACWYPKNTYVPNRLFQAENKSTYLEKMFEYEEG
ncbi:MAG: DUF3822 family protein, partial [Saprospiraceae bacterium]